LGTAWDELILSVDNGTGKLSTTIKGFLDIARAMLLMASGSQAANEALSKMSSYVIETANRWLGYLSILWDLVKVYIALRLWMFAWRSALVAVSAIQTLYAAGLALNVMLGKANIVTLRSNAMALGILRTVQVATAASTWGLNAAMWANPAIMIVAGIAAMVGGFMLMNRWVNSVMGSFNGLSGSMFDANEQMQKFFMDDSIPNSPVGKVMDQLAKIEAAKKEGTLGFGYDPLNSSSARINPKATEKEIMNNFFNNKGGGDQTMRIVIDDPKGYVKETQNEGSGITPTVSSTMPYGFGNN
jgi:hypothetical protein